MTIYVVVKTHGQSTFCDRFGEEAAPTTEILGARTKREEAEQLRNRMTYQLLDEALLTGDAENINVDIITLQIPDDKQTHAGRRLPS